MTWIQLSGKTGVMTYVRFLRDTQILSKEKRRRCHLKKLFFELISSEILEHHFTTETQEKTSSL